MEPLQNEGRPQTTIRGQDNEIHGAGESQRELGSGSYAQEHELAKLGRLGEARAEFERAASLTRNNAERKMLLARAVASDEELMPT